jgi:hypothetical protein
MLSNSLVWDVPVFDFFKTYDHGISATLHHVGDIHSLADYNALVPGSGIRVEMERTPDIEEIRVVQDLNGDYHATVNSTVARDILKVVDAQTSDLFEFGVKAYPNDVPPGEEKNSDFHRHIIRYDENKGRILPGIRKAGYVHTIEEYKAKETGNVWVMEEEEFVGITDTSTGDVWWATDELKKEILERVEAADLSCPMYSDDDEEGKGEEQPEDKSS